MPRFAPVFETWQAGASQMLGRTHRRGDGVMNFLFVRNRFAHGIDTGNARRSFASDTPVAINCQPHRRWLK
jgi:hypothetical protein